MDWLFFAFALELGAIRGTDLPVDVSSYVQMESAAIVLGHIEIGGALRSYQIPDNAQWWPFQMDYTVGATARFGNLSFGVEHLCRHTVIPFNTYLAPPIDEWSERAFVRIATTPSRP